MHGFRFLAAALALVVSASTALAVEDATKYEAYRSRLAARHASALAARRNAARFQRGQIYTIPSTQSLSYPVTPLNAIQQGIVTLPAIPRPIRSFESGPLVFPTRRLNTYRGITLSVGSR